MLTAGISPTPEIVAELQTVVSTDKRWQERLEHAVCIVANGIEADVCSVYLLDNSRKRLVLRATVGLRQSCVNQLSMSLDDGLTGLVASKCEPVVEEDAPEHPRFKYFPEADEDAYRSFLGVPLFERGQIRGVLVVQTVDKRKFSESETRMLQAVATKLAAILRDIR